MDFNHILLEVYCTKNFSGNEGLPVPEFCAQTEDAPHISCLLNHCPFCGFTSCENSLCYADSSSEAEEILSFGMPETPEEANNIEKWKQIACEKIREAHDEYIVAMTTVKDLKLIRPRLEELSFKQEMLADEATMSFNAVNGGTLDFPKERWKGWYNRWIASDDPHYFYRYLFSEKLKAYVGEIAYHYEKETDRFICDVIIHAKYRGQGFGKAGLTLLCEAAKQHGIRTLYDDILEDNPSVSMFLKQGFAVERVADGVCTVKKDLD